MASEKKHHFRLTSKHLCIETATFEEMDLIQQMADEEMAIAYGEMIEGCRQHPEQYEWYCIWKMMRKDDGELIGDLCFKGLKEDGTVEIGYGIFPEYEGKGYTTEAVAALCEWALSNSAVDVVYAETDPGNAASQRVLAKCGFQPLGRDGKEGPRFYREAGKPVWIAIMLCLGMSIGMSIGTALGKSMAYGMPIGMAIGVAVGALLDSREAQRRKEYRQRLQLPSAGADSEK